VRGIHPTESRIGFFRTELTNPRHYRSDNADLNEGRRVLD
jgi:hypothetical protein